MATIKFMKHYVTDGSAKARVWYSVNLNSNRKCVCIYAKDYGNQLRKMFATAENYTDLHTDYIDTDTVRIYENDPLFAAAMARVPERKVYA